MSELRHWHYKPDYSGVVWLTLDRAESSANALSQPVMSELDSVLDTIRELSPPGLVIVSAKASGFIVGADVHEFEGLTRESDARALVRRGQGILQKLSDLPFPTVALINGAALGGGLELAMACDYRVAIDSEGRTLGLPEVMLGIHPGFGGTVRTVALAGGPAALDLMLTGRSLRPKQARAMGLVDRVTSADRAEGVALHLIRKRPPLHRAPGWLRLLSLPVLRQAVGWAAERKVRGSAKREHYPAPYAVLHLWEAHGGKGSAAYEAEADSIARLFLTPTSRNLVRVFHLRERLRSLVSAKAPLEQVHVVGAGIMGGDIASYCAGRGLTVTLQDRAAEYVEKALARAKKYFAKRFRGPGQAEEVASRLTMDLEADSAQSTDLVIEAIYEDLDAKRALFADIEPRLKPGALLATNTSSIKLELLAQDLAEPGRLIGLHFFNPVAKLPLVEVIRGQETDEAAFQRGLEFVKQIGKLPLPCLSAPGFLVNRVLAPYMLEAMYAHSDGLALEIIDRAAQDFGMPVGPVELADQVGLDVALHVAEILSDAFGGEIPPGIADRVKAGHLGVKTGRGFYAYKGRKAQKEKTIGEPPADLQDRLILPLVNEAVACYADGVVEDHELVDAGVIFGTGFAPFTGGPIQYARQRGVREVVGSLEQLAARYGERFKPHPGWKSIK